jgi:hypothetical protein
MSNTPETDNLARGNHVVPTEFAQQLEVQRDEARGWAEAAWAKSDRAEKMLRTAAAKADQYRKALQEIASLDTSQDASPQQCAAVLLAMNALDQ